MFGYGLDGECMFWSDDVVVWMVGKRGVDVAIEVDQAQNRENDAAIRNGIAHSGSCDTGTGITDFTSSVSVAELALEKRRRLRFRFIGSKTPYLLISFTVLVS